MPNREIGAEMEGLIGLLILVISAIGWIANAVQEQKAKQKQPPGPAQRPQPQRRLQEEIENFLKEIQPAQPEAQPAAEPNRPPAPRRGKNRPEVSKRAKDRKATAQQRNPSPNLTKTSNTSSQLTGLPADIRPSARLGTAEELTPAQFQQYLQSQAEQGFSRELLAILSPEQVAAIQQHARQASPRGPRSASGRVTVAQLLSSENIRNSFVINEILQRPKIFRK